MNDAATKSLINRHESFGDGWHIISVKCLWPPLRPWIRLCLVRSFCCIIRLCLNTILSGWGQSYWYIAGWLRAVLASITRETAKVNVKNMVLLAPVFIHPCLADWLEKCRTAYWLEPIPTIYSDRKRKKKKRKHCPSAYWILFAMFLQTLKCSCVLLYGNWCNSWRVNAKFTRRRKNKEYDLFWRFN